MVTTVSFFRKQMRSFSEAKRSTRCWRTALRSLIFQHFIRTKMHFISLQIGKWVIRTDLYTNVSIFGIFSTAFWKLFNIQVYRAFFVPPDAIAVSYVRELLEVRAFFSSKWRIYVYYNRYRNNRWWRRKIYQMYILGYVDVDSRLRSLGGMVSAAGRGSFIESATTLREVAF